MILAPQVVIISTLSAEERPRLISRCFPIRDTSPYHYTKQSFLESEVKAVANTR